ncbi:SusD/RagB family nutrient-binding outer membrane lipoprotein [Olivibacter domesticus]|uniref:Starch-binding associating with outer membrane n=1 Tax=Olivibacter domesticus TaxID=407022 RepID=A0A1H7TML4_OLID1|nr:SusD/RagB family nutrient-binding outer membrane lipoprotein [Olivibacter domesticus]SEL86122.1 Starch-binding associating with outer membrane [Olivibacter domesticus]
MKSYIAYITTFAALTFSSCEKFLDVNENPNQPSTVQESLILPAIEFNLVHNVVAGWASINAAHFMQLIALNQAPPNTGTYLLNPVDLNDTWRYTYTDCLQNLKLLKEQADEKGNDIYAGIANVLTAYTIAYATDMWGDVPYSQGLNATETFRPAYDSQETVYTTIQSLLDEAIAKLTTGEGSAPGDRDFFYNGNTEQWVKAAYTLKARYYMHLSKAPNHNATEQAQLALNALENGMQSNDDDLCLVYDGTSGRENRWYRNFLPVETIVLSSKTVDSLVSRADPRLDKLISRSKLNNNYKGRSIGSAGIGALEEYSLGGSFYANANSPLYLINYREALLLKAEATLILSGLETAAPFYRQAIEADMAHIGVSSSTAIATYLASRGNINADNALSYMMEEKAVVNFLSPEIFNDWRRTGYPAINKVQNAVSDIPRKMLYPLNELTNNPQPQQSADALTKRVWWDAQ